MCGRQRSEEGAGGHRFEVPEVTLCPAELVAAVARGQAVDMATTLRSTLVELFAPLSIAAYVAWGMVLLTADFIVAARHPDLLIATRLALCAFLLLFTTEHMVARRLGMPGLAVTALAMGGIALFVMALTPHGASPILLVLLAAMLASRLADRALLLALLLVNLGFVLVAFAHWPGRPVQIGITVLAHASFQVFAVLVMRYAARAEELAENLQAINAELLTTRTLLAEGARDHERLNLSRELHDVAGHSLTALKLNLGALARDARQPDPQRVALCGQLADELLQNLRDVVKAMRQNTDSDIQPALQRLAAPFPRPTLQLQVDSAARWLPAAVFEAVLRAVQEALTNAARHGQAQQLQVTLRRDGGELVLDIEDDGRIPAHVIEGGGLSGMRERFESLHGSLQVRASARGGMQLHARCPLQPPA